MQDLKTRFGHHIYGMESLSSKNKSFKYLLCVIDVLIKYAWAKPLQGKEGKTVLIAFIEVVNESNHESNKLCFDQGREFYKKLMQECLGSNNVLMYLTNNEGKSLIAERFIKTLKVKIYKKIPTFDSVFPPYLNKLVDQCNNTYHYSIEKNPINSDYSAMTEKTERSSKAPKFKVNYRVRIPKHKIRVFVVKITLKIGQDNYLSLILF